MQDSCSQCWLKSRQGSEESHLPCGNFPTAKTPQEPWAPAWVEVFYMTDGDTAVSARLPYNTMFPQLLWPSPWRKDATLPALASCLAYKGVRTWWRRSQPTPWSSPPPSQLLSPLLLTTTTTRMLMATPALEGFFAMQAQSVRCIVYLLTFILHKENTQYNATFIMHVPSYTLAWTERNKIQSSPAFYPLPIKCLSTKGAKKNPTPKQNIPIFP